MTDHKFPVSRNGRYRVVDTQWDHNGTLRVTCAMANGAMLHTAVDVRGMRDTARRAISQPEKTRSARLTRVWIKNDACHMSFAVSRLPA